MISIKQFKALVITDFKKIRIISTTKRYEREKNKLQ